MRERQDRFQGSPKTERPTGASWSRATRNCSLASGFAQLAQGEWAHRTSDVANPEVNPKIHSIEQMLARFDRLMTADEVAAILSIPRNGVYALRNSGQLSAIKLHRHYRWDPATVWRFVQAASGGDEGRR